MQRAPRRTQAERRAATRAALLDAAVAALVREGHQGATLRAVATGAGVSIGALQHHFDGRSGLLIDVFGLLSDRIADDVLRPVDALPESAGGQAAALLDRLWEAHRGEAFVASLEIGLAARTAPDLAPALRQHDARATGRVLGSVGAVYPLVGSGPGHPQALAAAVAAVRGIALDDLLGPRDAARHWPGVRAELVRLLVP